MIGWLRKRKARASEVRVREIEADIARLDAIIHEPVVKTDPYRPRLNWAKDASGAWTCNGQRLDYTSVHGTSACSGPHPVRWVGL